MKVACLSIRHLPFKTELHRSPHLRGRPAIVANANGSRRVVLDASPEATGVLPGMPLDQALSRCKNAVLLEADLSLYQRGWERVLEALEQRSPDVEDAEPGLAYVRLDGLELMYGGDARLVTALLNAVPDRLEPRIGVAEGKFPAYVAAGLGGPGGATKVPEDVRAFLSPLSVDLLPVSWEVRARLHDFGLHTLGQAAALHVGPLQAQFGPTGRTVWELANGIDARPLLPRRREETVTEALTFPAPIIALEAIVTAADTLLARGFGRREMQGRFARVCTLEGAVFRAPTWQRRMVFREPLADRRRAVTLVKHTLEGRPPHGPLEDLRVTLAGLTGEAGRQESLFHDVRRRENLREALRQLQARLGKQPPIYQVREVEPWSRLPERRQALVPYAP